MKTTVTNVTLCHQENIVVTKENITLCNTEKALSPMLPLITNGL